MVTGSAQGQSDKSAFVVAEAPISIHARINLLNIVLRLDTQATVSYEQRFELVCLSPASVGLEEHVI